ncbi:hypothetical protein JQK87_10060 [Streptomyces sp. G44]|uniref:hypothetical protein n=1 Tax=Streptomyces sp. G44 TaxID=2807632 RepID=UPI001961E783|nr:hypothetical protein [Streptomyces sp. G44]MBM7168748.1 hypothetical protein [Streptomyces sp. G44]
MPESATGPSEAHTFPALCAHTHLFPGARCRLQGLPDPHAFTARPWSIGVDLRFADDAVAEAELRTDGPRGPVLVVPPYTTGAGTRIGERAWLIREFTRVGREVEVRLGGHA